MGELRRISGTPSARLARDDTAARRRILHPYQRQRDLKASGSKTPEKRESIRGSATIPDPQRGRFGIRRCGDTSRLSYRRRGLAPARRLFRRRRRPLRTSGRRGRRGSGEGSEKRAVDLGSGRDGADSGTEGDGVLDRDELVDQGDGRSPVHEWIDRGDDGMERRDLEGDREAVRVEEAGAGLESEDLDGDARFERRRLGEVRQRGGSARRLFEDFEDDSAVHPRLPGIDELGRGRGETALDERVGLGAAGEFPDLDRNALDRGRSRGGRVGLHLAGEQQANRKQADGTGEDQGEFRVADGQ